MPIAPAMREAGCDVWEDAETLAVMGLVEPIKVLPRLLRLRRSLIRRWVADPPDVFVGVDAPDFNLGLEKALRSRGDRIAEIPIWDWMPYSDGVSEEHLRRNRPALLQAIASARAHYDAMGRDATR